MMTTGNLRTSKLSDLLDWAAAESKTGVLVVDRGHIEKRVFFLDGEVTAASSNDARESLSSLVLRLGLVDETRLGEILEELDGADELLGRYLVRNGEISEGDLSGLMRVKTQETLFDLFDWGAGDYRFEEDEVNDDSLVMISLDIGEVNREADARNEMWQKIRRFLPDGHAIPVAIGFLNDPTFDARQRMILRQVDDNSTVAQIALRSNTTEYEVSCALVSALEAGKLKVVTPTEQVEPKDNSLALSTGITLLDSDSLIGAASRHFDDHDFEKALRYMKAAKMLEPNNQEIIARCREMETRIEELLDRAGVRDPVVPRLLVSMDQISDMEVSPNAGFLMTRVDGSSDLRSILKMTPIAPVEAKLLVYRLMQQGHVTLDPKN